MLVNKQWELEQRPPVGFELEFTLPYEWQKTEIGTVAERLNQADPWKWVRMNKLAKVGKVEHINGYLNKIKHLCHLYEWKFGVVYNSFLIYMRKIPKYFRFLYAFCLVVAERTAWPLDVVMERCDAAGKISKTSLRRLITQFHIIRPHSHPNFYLDKLLQMPAVDSLRKWNPTFFTDFAQIQPEVAKTFTIIQAQTIITVNILAYLYNSPLNITELAEWVETHPEDFHYKTSIQNLCHVNITQKIARAYTRTGRRIVLDCL